MHRKYPAAEHIHIQDVITMWVDAVLYHIYIDGRCIRTHVSWEWNVLLLCHHPKLRPRYGSLLAYRKPAALRPLDIHEHKHTHTLMLFQPDISLETKRWNQTNATKVVIYYPIFYIVWLMCLNQRQIETISIENVLHGLCKGMSVWVAVLAY